MKSVFMVAVAWAEICETKIGNFGFFTHKSSEQIKAACARQPQLSTKPIYLTQNGWDVAENIHWAQ